MTAVVAGGRHNVVRWEPFSPSHSLYLETREIAETEAAAASDTRRRGRGPVGTPITTGRAPSWLSEENLAVTMAVKLLPNSSIDGANQVKEVWASKIHTSFLKYAPPAIGATSKEWYCRSGRAYVEHWRRIHKACARLRSCHLQVVEQRLTGDIEDDPLLRLALARYNKIMDPSNV
jgi:hypothetical protein